MGIRDKIRQLGGEAADAVSRLSALSPEQLQDVEEQRNTYLSQKPDPQDTAAEELTKRLLAAGSVEIYQAYLAQLNELYLPVEREAEYGGATFVTKHNIRFFNITKWVVDKEENSLEKLVNVYAVLSNEDCNISLIFHRTCTTTHVYLAVTNTRIRNPQDNIDVNQFQERLGGAIRGNFPGSEWAEKIGEGTPPCLDNDDAYSVAIASNIPTEKSEKFISQTIEKLLDGIVPDKRDQEYIVILLATPIRDVESRKLQLADLYSGLAPYASWTTSFTYDEQGSIGSSATVGINMGTSAGVQAGQNQSLANTTGTTDSTGSSDTESTGSSETKSSGKSITDSTGSSTADSRGISKSNTTSHSTGSNKSHADSTGTTLSAGISGSATTSATAGAGFEPLGVGGKLDVTAGTTVGGNLGISGNISNTDTFGFCQ